jgi:succinate dehydrogenase hydrophobic anchor subunit
MATANTPYSPTERAGRSGLAGALWLVQAFSGILLIALLGLHMVAHHFVVEGGLRNYEQVIDYISNPVIFVLEVVFLLTVTAHAMLGVRAILLDLGPGPGAQRAINVGITVVGVVAAGYGIWLAVALQGLV